MAMTEAETDKIFHEVVEPLYRDMCPDIADMLPSLHQVLTMDIAEFGDLATLAWKSPHKWKNDPELRTFYIDSGAKEKAKILAVGHLDVNGKPTKQPAYSAFRHTIHARQLDDRLGVWMILWLLPHFTKVPYDILLTDGEESGQSTAKIIDKAKLEEMQAFREDGEVRWNWMFEMDRQGTNMVSYEYESPEVIALCEKSGWHHEQGSYTDIRDLHILKRVGFNFGIGYHGQHSDGCKGSLLDVIKCCMRTAHMIDTQGDNTLVWTPKVSSHVNHSAYQYQGGYYGQGTTPTGRGEALADDMADRSFRKGGGHKGGKKKDVVKLYDPVTKTNRGTVWLDAVAEYAFEYNKSEITKLRTICKGNPEIVFLQPHVRDLVVFYLGGTVPVEYTAYVSSQLQDNARALILTGHGEMVDSKKKSSIVPFQTPEGEDSDEEYEDEDEVVLCLDCKGEIDIEDHEVWSNCPHCGCLLAHDADDEAFILAEIATRNYRKEVREAPLNNIDDGPTGP